jgi:hypothetical protein
VLPTKKKKKKKIVSIFFARMAPLKKKIISWF